MKIWLTMLCTGALAGAAFAQSPPKPSPPTKSQTQPTQTPAPTKTAPPSRSPEDPHTATRGSAAKKAFQAGTKPDDSAGCSTPTDARSAGVDTSHDSPTRQRSNGKRTVCTTAGAEGVHAKDQPKKKKPKEAKPAPNLSPNPR